MPRSARWFIKAGIIWLMAGVLLAGLTEMPGLKMQVSLLAVYWHMIVVGWITQVIMGVSIWMFPGRRRMKNRDEDRLQWLVFGFLNTGLVLRFAAEPFLADGSLQAPAIQLAVIISAILQVSAVVLYIIEMWPRLGAKKKKSGA